VEGALCALFNVGFGTSGCEMSNRRKNALRLAVLGLFLAGASGAHAYFTHPSTGNGPAAVATAAAVTIAPATPAGGLYPGGSADVAFTITNPNPFQVRVGSLVLDTSRGAGGFAVDAGHSACSDPELSFPANSGGGAGWYVPPNDTLDLDLPAAITMGTGADVACQGATFTVYLEAQG
jgi:hypothetical protein